MTAAMVGFGALLYARHRLTRREAPLAEVPAQAAAFASRSLLQITALCAAICAGIIAARMYAGKPIAGLSVLMPATGLAVLLWLGRKMQKAGAARVESTGFSDRPSPRPPKRESLAPPRPQSDAASNRHVSA